MAHRHPKDYISYITITDDKKQSKDGCISINNIFTYNFVRLYQTSYDDDGNGTYLTINSDPYGIAISYTGYDIFFSLIWLLIDPNGSYRKLLKSPLLKKANVVHHVSMRIFFCYTSRIDPT